MRPRAAFFLVASAALLVGVAGACGSSYAPHDEPAEAGPPDAVAPPDDSGGPSVDPCLHAQPPGPPAADDAPDLDLPDIVLAVDKVTLGAAVGGFDLDGTCTCDGRPGGAHDAGPSCVTTGVLCDLDGGVDNTLGVGSDQFGAFLKVDSIPNGLIAAGRRGGLLVIRGYNGKANDKSVSVASYVSDGIRSDAGCPDASFDAKRGTYTPGWCGNDPWSIDTASVAAGNIPTTFGNGYVVDYHLVARVTSGDVRLPMGDVQTIALHEAIVSAQLVPAGGGSSLFRISAGIVAGRASPHDVLAGFGTQVVGGPVDDGGFAERFCQQAAFAQLKTQLCAGRDVTKSQLTDFTNAPCDSISTSVGFTALPAVMGEPYTAVPPGDPCEPGADGEPTQPGVTYSCPP